MGNRDIALENIEKCRDIVASQPADQYFLTLKDKHGNRLFYPVDSREALVRELDDIAKEKRFRVVSVIKGQRITQAELLTMYRGKK